MDEERVMSEEEFENIDGEGITEDGDVFDESEMEEGADDGELAAEDFDEDIIGDEDAFDGDDELDVDPEEDEEDDTEYEGETVSSFGDEE